MPHVDLTFLQDSAHIFQSEFIDKYYEIETYSGNTLLIINSVKNYPHLIGIKPSYVARLHGSQNIFSSIINNDVSTWTEAMKRMFLRVFPLNTPHGNNEYKILFFPLMPEIFTHENYVISVNYDKSKRTDTRPFNTEVLISDFNAGMNLGMKQRSNGSFGFNSWRVEENEAEIMDMYLNQEIDLIKKITQYKSTKIINTKLLRLTDKNIWRLSRLKKNYNATFLPSIYLNDILFLANYDDTDFDQAFDDLLQETNSDNN